jgi:hypothetical protein
MKVKIIQTLKGGFNILKKNPKIFVPALITALLSAYLFYIIIIDSFRTFFEALWIVVLLVIASLLVSLFLGGMIIRMAYDAKRGKPSLGKSARFVASKYITLLVASIISGIIVMLGFVALFIPGIFLGVKLFFVQYGILIGNKGVVSSLKNSWKITKGNWWRVFILMIVFSIVSMLISSVVAISSVLGIITSLVASLLIIPWQLSSFTLAYLQLKKK